SACSVGHTLRTAIIRGGPAGSSTAEVLIASGVETYLIECNPTGSKPFGSAIPLYMLDEFSIPAHLVNRRVTRMRIFSPSNLAVDFSRSLRPAIVFQEWIRLPPEKMAHYEDLAEMYVGSNVSPDFYRWVFMGNHMELIRKVGLHARLAKRQANAFA
ncbi:hypothetical protein COCNU_08G000200, partial [Cocos nucifera]